MVSFRPALRRLTVPLSVVLVAPVLAVGVGAADPGVAPAEVVGEAAASAAAVRFGESVVVADKTSETEQVVANPDGTFVSTRSLRPVRVREDGEWVPVDLTLEHRADGTIGPRVAAVDLRLSGGGAGSPVVVVGDSGREVGLGWQGSLPAPSLDGPTATYAEVLPGVDLTVTADVEGFTQLLVVKNREAAANPELQSISFTHHRMGTTVAGGEEGLEVRSSDGQLVFSGDASRMWDSADRQAQMGVSVTDSAITISPDQGFLADAQTSYPVYVDPSYYAYGRKNHHAMVQSAWPGEHNYDQTGGDLGDLKAGFVCAGPCFNSRSYVEMATDGMPGKFIHSAQLSMKVLHSHDCRDAGPTELWRTDGISYDTTWGNQPVWREYQSESNQTNNWEHCPDSNGGGTQFSVTNALKLVSANGWRSVTFGLRGKDEANDNFWRRFDLNPLLEVWYNSYPGTPDQLATVSGTKSFPCATGTSRPYLADVRPFLSARFTDQDPGMLNARFYYGPVGQPASGSVGTTNIPPGTTRSVQVPAGAFANNGVYAWWAQSADDQLFSPPSAKCEVAIDTVPPGAPGVSSSDYPPGSTGGNAGDTGVFQLSANGTTDVVKYVYTTDGNDPTVLGSRSVSPAALGGGATIRVTAREGENVLRVASVDRADNRGPVMDFRFVADAMRAPAVERLLDRQLEDLSYAGTGTVGWAAGYRGDAWLGSAASNDHLLRSAATADMTKNFSVSAWARLDTSIGDATILSQDGTNVSGFSVQYLDNLDRWAFRAATGDVVDAGWVNAVSVAPPAWRTWTHLVGTYDVNERKLRLYVNGVLEGETDYTPTWSAGGPFVAGAGKYNGSRTDYFTGAVDDVRVWDRVVGPLEAARLANAPVARAFYKLDEGTGTAAKDEISGLNGSLVGDVKWDVGEFRSGKFSGAPGGYVSGRTPAVVPGQSFTVSAWVRTDVVDSAKRAAVAIGDPAYSPFLLGYNGPQQRWEFFVVNSGHTASWTALSAQPAPVATWAHLTGVYDAVTDEIRLYVNGEETATVAGVGAGAGSGALLIGGGGRWNGQPVASWKGLVDDVRLYSGVLDFEQMVMDMNSRDGGR